MFVKKISIDEKTCNLIKSLNNDTRLMMYDAIVEYLLEWKEYNGWWIEEIIFNTIKEQVNKDKKISSIRSSVSKWHKWWNQYTTWKVKQTEPTKKEDVKTSHIVQDNNSVKKEWLKKYWQYVELTDEEYKKLVYQFGSCSWICSWVEAHLKLNSKTVDDKIESMNNYIINWKWKPYPDYYMELRSRFKREWKTPYWERGSLEDMKAYLEKENSWQLYYRTFTEFYDKVEEIRDTLWKINVDRDLDFFDTHKWHFFLDYN